MSDPLLRRLVRDVPDFPKPGILFKDITPVLADPVGFRRCIERMIEPWLGRGIRQVVGIESRGFLFGAPMAHALGAGFVPVRKPKKLPYKVDRETYALEYGEDTLEMHVDALGPGVPTLVVDDLLATGGTASAAIRLAERQGAHVVGCAFVVELEALKGRGRLGSREITTVLTY